MSLNLLAVSEATASDNMQTQAAGIEIAFLEALPPELRADADPPAREAAEAGATPAEPMPAESVPERDGSQAAGPSGLQPGTHVCACVRVFW